jgi:hypothetical protein
MAAEVAPASDEDWLAGLARDKASRLIIKQSLQSAQSYTTSEDCSFAKGVALEATVDNPNSKPGKHKSTSPLVSDAIVTYSEDGGLIIVQASTKIRSDALDIVSYLLDFESYHNIKVDFGSNPSIFVSKVVARPNAHHWITWYGNRVPNPLSDRDFVQSVIYKKISEKEHVVAIRHTDHAEAPQLPGVVRARMTRCLRVKQISPKVTSLKVSTKINLGGSFPIFLNNKLSVPSSVRLLHSCVLYFAQIKEKAECDADDARILAQLLVDHVEQVRTMKDKRFLEDRITHFASCSEVLRDMPHWFQTLVVSALRSTPRPPKRVVNSLPNYTVHDANNSGSALALQLLSNATPENAVDDWFLAHPALVELDSIHPFFRPFMVVISTHLLSVADFGTKLRLIMGASISMLDLVSDAFVITALLSDDATMALGYVNLTCVLLCLCMQLGMVWLQNQKRSWMVIAVEMLYVLMALKPGVDARRVAIHGVKRIDKDSTLDPLVEMSFNRGVEMIYESIPSGVIQARALILTTKRSKLAIVSVIISCVATSFASASLWYDYDINPGKRKNNPYVAGAVPDQGRTLVFLLAVAAGTMQVLGKVFATALLSIASPAVLAIYIGVDQAAYLLLKAYRRDMTYSLIPTNTSIAVSVAYRSGMKVMVDFTGCLLLKNPHDLGGAYFLFNQVTNFGSVFLAVRIFSTNASNLLDTGMLWTSAFCLFATWLLLYGMFMSKLKKECRPSFYSTKTGNEMCEEIFAKGRDDEMKMTVFIFNEVKWKSISGGVSTYTHANWAMWTEEQPEWFTEECIAKVPDEFIPLDARQALDAAAAGGVRRRSSFGMLLSEQQRAVVAAEAATEELDDGAIEAAESE